MRNLNVKYSLVFLDNRLDNLVESIDKYFGITTKGSFVVLLNYAIVNYEKLNRFDYTYEKGKKGFRIETDNDYDTLLLSMIPSYLDINSSEYTLEEVLTNNTVFNEIFNDLVNLSCKAGVYLLENELFSYKNRVSPSNVEFFIQDILRVLLNITEIKNKER